MQATYMVLLLVITGQAGNVRTKEEKMDYQKANCQDVWFFFFL